MTCPICGGEYSDKVYRIHAKKCTRQPATIDSYTKDELIELAELAGITINKRWSKKVISDAIEESE